MQHFKLTIILRSFFLTAFLFLLIQPATLLAEGTNSIAPSTADEAALFVGAGNTGTRGGDYGLFAWKDSDSKLYFNIQNRCEKVFMGFSTARNDRSFLTTNPVYGGSGIDENLIFRIIDPLGNPVNNLSCFGNIMVNGEAWQTLNSNTANIPNRGAADNGPAQLGNAGGYNGFELDLSACGLNLTGNYSIEFFSTDANYDPNTPRSGFYIPYFDITVANCANQGMTGRVWSNNWGIGIKRDGDGSFDRAFNGTLFVCSSEGFITKIDFNTNTNNRTTAGKDTDQRSGFRAGSFNISFNRQGPGNSGDIIADRQSLPNANAPNPELPVFLNLPDEAFCPVRELGEIKAAANFVTGCPQDRCINVAATQPGQFEIIIEGANGNGILDQPSERRVIYQITEANKVANPETAGFIYEACIPWDGKDGNGNLLLEVAITVTGNYFQGIYHFPVYDAEFNDDGFIVETVRPALGRQLLYYDDTKITEIGGTSEPKDGTNGCNGPCHRWTGEWGDYADKDDNYGNYNTINTWWFASTSLQDFTSNVGQLSPLDLVCPADFVGCASQSIDPNVTGKATTVPENLDCNFVLDYTDVVITDDCDKKVVERNWFAYLTDLPNKRATCKQTITLKAPVLANCPSNVVLDCSANNTYTWTPPTIEGACSGTVRQTSGPVSGSAFSTGITTITYEVGDGCTTQTCSFTVTVKDAGDLDDLTIICPTELADVRDCPIQSTDPSVTGTPTVVNKSNCPTTLDYTDKVTDNGCGTKTIKREWVVYFTNKPSVRKTCTQIITITAPIISNCPSDVVLGCGDGNVYSWNTPTINDGCDGTAIQTSGPASGSVFPVGTTTITYQVGGGCANQVCSFTVTVSDSGDPDDLSIICPTELADVRDCPIQSTDPSVTGTPTVVTKSNCPTTLDYTDNVTDNGCGAKTIKREWVVYFTNKPSVRKTCTQLITIAAPIISNCPSDVVLGCGNGNIYSWNTPTINDGCDGTAIQTSGPASGSAFPVGTTTITYQVGGGCANQVCSFTVTVSDSGDPDDLSIICPTELADVRDCPIQSTDPSVTGTPTVVTKSNCPTTLDYTDKVTDNGCGAKTIKREWVVYFTNKPSVRKTCTQIITIIAPTLTNCPASVVLGCGDGNIYSWNTPTVNDGCDGTVIQTSGPVSGSVFPVGTTTITYQVGGGCANQVCSFTVTVSDAGNPADLTIICPTVPADVSDCPGQSTNPSVTGTPTVVTNSNCPTTLDYTDIITDNGCGAKTIKREWVVYFTNKPSVRKTCTQIITTTAPTLTNCPTDVVLTCEDGNTHSWAPPTISGNCGGTVTQTSGPASGSSFPVGVTTITYSVGGGCTNQTCSFTVTVTEGGLTVNNCPTDVVLDCVQGQEGAHYSWDLPTASSCCNDCPTPGLDLADFVYMGTLNGHQYYCSKEKADWRTAKATCESQGGFLAVINSEEENQLLSNFLNDQSAYIGLNDFQQEGVYEWCNGDPLTYSNWYPGQPNNYGNNQDVTRLLPNGLWDDITHLYKLEYILEIPCLTIQQTAGPTSGSVFPVGTTQVAYQIKDNCGNEESCNFQVTVNPCASVNDYCDITGKNTTYFWIRHVVCGDINNATGSNHGYGDYSNLNTSMHAGSDQTIILSPGYARNKYYVNWRVWIDYNRDGDFNDAHEELFTFKDYNILKIRFSVPRQCAIGQTRMRVSMKYGNPANCCEDFIYGEVEDYTINLLPPTDNLRGITSTNRSNTNVEVEVIPHESNAPLKTLLPTEMATLSMFPNPVSDELQVQLTDYQQLNGTLRIYNQLGQIVHQDPLTTDSDQQFSISVAHLPDGMYLLSVESEGETPMIEKFTKY